jgi:hypothetical protein
MAPMGILSWSVLGAMAVYVGAFASTAQIAGIAVCVGIGGVAAIEWRREVVRERKARRLQRRYGFLVKL